MKEGDRVRIVGTQIFGTVTTTDSYKDKKGAWIRFGENTGEINHIREDNPIYYRLSVEPLPPPPELKNWASVGQGYVQRVSHLTRTPRELLVELRQDVRTLEKYLSAVEP